MQTFGSSICWKSFSLKINDLNEFIFSLPLVSELTSCLVWNPHQHVHIYKWELILFVCFSSLPGCHLLKSQSGDPVTSSTFSLSIIYQSAWRGWHSSQRSHVFDLTSGVRMSSVSCTTVFIKLFSRWHFLPYRRAVDGSEVQGWDECGVFDKPGGGRVFAGLLLYPHPAHAHTHSSCPCQLYRCPLGSFVTIHAHLISPPGLAISLYFII